MTYFVQFARDSATGQIIFDASGNPVFSYPAGANTYGAMQTRIAYEVLGSPQPSDITNAIQDAITEFERESFYWNDMRTFTGSTGSASNFQTNAGQEFYSWQDLPVLINMPHIRDILVLAFNNRYPLVQRTQEWIDDVSISTTWQGLPTDWCMVNNFLRLYPVPNGGYPLILTGTIRYPALVNSTDTNPWMNEGEQIIRYEAKRLLFTHITRDPDQAAEMRKELYGDPDDPRRQGVVAMARRETMRRAGGTGRIRPSRGYL